MDDQADPMQDEVLIDPAALDGTLEEVRISLGLSIGRVTENLFDKLRDVAQQFASRRLVKGYYENPAQQKRLIKQISGQIDKMLDLLYQVSPEHIVMLNSLVEQERGIKPLSGKLVIIEDVEHTKAAIDKFVERYRPARGAAVDLPLEDAVRRLIVILEKHTGGVVTTSMNKNNDKQPALRSAEANTIGVLLRLVDPTLPVSKIANMIEKVRLQPWPSDSHFAAIWDTDPMVFSIEKWAGNQATD